MDAWLEVPDCSVHRDPWLFPRKKVVKASKSVWMASLSIQQQPVTSSSCPLPACEHTLDRRFALRRFFFWLQKLADLSLVSLYRSSRSHFHACGVKRLCVGGNDAERKNRRLHALGCKWACIWLSIKQRAGGYTWKRAAGGRRAIPPHPPPPQPHLHCSR